jgi:nucleoside phosphorylase
MVTHFFSPEPRARIEPRDFMTHVLAYRGLDASSFGLRPTVIVALLPELERRLLRLLGSPIPHPHTVQRQTLYNPADAPFSIIASPMGAPMAVMLLEQLIALGARRFFYVGFCGALASSYRIGDGLIPTQAIREEGTSYHYLPAGVVPTSSPHLNTYIQTCAAKLPFAVQQGPIWTTDAPYRETSGKIQHYQAAGVHAVDMEMAAVFAVAQYRGCEIAALLLVSDECYHFTWRPGFGVDRLRRSCQAAAEACVAAAWAAETVTQVLSVSPR